MSQKVLYFIILAIVNKKLITKDRRTSVRLSIKV